MTQTQVKMRPMLFQTSMVQAILEGRKTQTRRIIKESFNGCLFNGGPHPCPNEPVVMYPGDVYGSPIEGEEPIVNNDPQVRALFHCSTLESEAKCPYGKVGDVIYVRETYTILEPEHCIDGMDSRFVYKADMKHRQSEDIRQDYIKSGYPYQWKPSLFMPKEAARVFLKITDIRVERLQDISEEDAIAEGVESMKVESAEWGKDTVGKTLFKKYPFDFSRGVATWSAKESFERLWESINGKDSWNLNPWLWVVSFQRIDKPENA